MRDNLFDVQPAQERIDALRKVSTFYLSAAGGDAQGTDRILGEIHQTFGWTKSENLAEADIVLFFQSKTFVEDFSNTIRGNRIPYVDGSGSGQAPGPMPQQVQRKTVALITNTKTPRLLFMYQLDISQGIWSPAGTVRNLKEFIESSAD